MEAPDFILVEQYMGNKKKGETLVEGVHPFSFIFGLLE